MDPGPSIDDEELMHQHWTRLASRQTAQHFIRALPRVLGEAIEGVRLLVVHLRSRRMRRSFKDVGSGATDEEILWIFRAGWR